MDYGAVRGHTPLPLPPPPLPAAPVAASDQVSSPSPIGNKPKRWCRHPKWVQAKHQRTRAEGAGPCARRHPQGVRRGGCRRSTTGLALTRLCRRGGCRCARRDRRPLSGRVPAGSHFVVWGIYGNGTYAYAAPEGDEATARSGPRAAGSPGGAPVVGGAGRRPVHGRPTRPPSPTTLVEQEQKKKRLDGPWERDRPGAVPLGCWASSATWAGSPP